MIKPDVCEMIEFLNSLFEIDPNSISELLEKHVPCNINMAKHSTVQVLVRPSDKFRVGILGILNGFYGVYDDGLNKDYGAICAIYDNGKLKGFEKLLNEETITEIVDINYIS